MSAAFDTHATVKSLLHAGMSEAQAEALVAALRQIGESQTATLATKTDIADLRGEMKDLRGEMKDTEIRLVKWMIGIAFATTALNLTVFALFV